MFYLKFAVKTLKESSSAYKSTNMGILAVGTTNQLFMRGS